MFSVLLTLCAAAILLTAIGLVGDHISQGSYSHRQTVLDFKWRYGRKKKKESAVLDTELFVFLIFTKFLLFCTVNNVGF